MSRSSQAMTNGKKPKLHIKENYFMLHKIELIYIKFTEIAVLIHCNKTTRLYTKPVSCSTMAYLNSISYYKSLRNCDNELKVFKFLSIIHIQMLATGLAIMWRQYIAEPIYCVGHMSIPEDQIPRKDYSRILGYHYIQNLLSKCGIFESCYPVRRNTPTLFSIYI
jgi:hypothetical protein